MKQVKATLPNGFKLYAIESGESSPMLSHRYGEIAADDESHAFYVHESLLITNGMSSVLRACNQYEVQQ